MTVENETIGMAAPLRRPSLVRADIDALRRYRSLVRYLVSATLKTERTGSVFGFLWWLLDPVLLMLVYWLLFGVIFRRSEPDFPIFILLSLVSWEFFITSVNASMSMTVAQERSMRQVAFPRSVIPLSVTAAEFLHLVVGLAFAAVAAFAFYGVVPSSKLLLVFPLFVMQAAFTLGLAFLFSALNFFYRDVSHLAGYLFRIWYFLSPGIYAITRIPAHYRRLYELNPFATFFGGFHAAVLHQPTPGPAAFGYTAVLSLALLAFSYRIFVRMAPRFAKVV